MDLRRFPRAFRCVCQLTVVWLATLGAGALSAPASAAPRPLDAGAASPPAHGTPAPAPAVPFMEDDFARATAAARARGVPLFVDAWAPWCHSCVSFRALVLTDPALRRLADDFIWLSLDTERPSSAAFLDRHPVSAWPTLLVLDVDAEGRTAVRRAHEGALRTADLLDWLSAARSRRALSAPWATRQRVIALRRQKHDSACVRAAGAATSFPRGVAQLDVALEGLTCALRLPAAEAARAASRFEALLEALAGDPDAPILADDRSSAYGALVDAAAARADDALARRRAARWASFLEAEAARAPSAAARAAFDAHRTEAYLALGQPLRAVAPLEQSARDFPGDYNPPARLARALLAAGRVRDAQAAIDRALALVYGPRRARLLALHDEITRAAADAGARRP